LLCNGALNTPYNNRVNVGNGVFYSVCAEEYLENNWGDPVS
jgi:hypothetical protein